MRQQIGNRYYREQNTSCKCLGSRNSDIIKLAPETCLSHQYDGMQAINVVVIDDPVSTIMKSGHDMDIFKQLYFLQLSHVSEIDQLMDNKCE